MSFLLKFACLFLVLASQGAHSRAVNLSSVWLLPEERYPVFYRYFRDRITWYEADAVCQFHHGDLITVDTNGQFDAARAYLKELDVANFVWTGLKRGSSKQNFLWPGSKAMENPEGHWAVEVPKMDEPLCAAVDPSSDYRWQPLPCSGPTVAAFICQMPVPSWAMKEDGCMITSLPSLTVTFLPEQGAVELTSDCGLDGTRRITCKGNTNREDIIRQLACESSTEASISDSWDETQPTRHRRESEVTSDMSVRPNTTQDMSEDDQVTEASIIAGRSGFKNSEIKKEKIKLATVSPSSPPSSQPTAQPSTVVSSKTPISTPAVQLLTPTTTTAPSTQSPVSTINTSPSTPKIVKQSTTSAPSEAPTSREPMTKAPTDRMLTTTKAPQGQIEVAIPLLTENNVAVSPDKRQSSKPIPPSLKGNSPFIDLSGQSSSTEPPLTSSTELPKNTSDETQGPPDSHEILGGPQEENPSREPAASLPTNPSLEQYKKNVQDSGEDHSEDPKATGGVTVGSPPGPTDDGGVAAGIVPGGAAALVGRSDLIGPNGPIGDDGPERPNRGRLLVHPQHHSFYAYFLNRVLG